LTHKYISPFIKIMANSDGKTVIGVTYQQESPSYN